MYIPFRNSRTQACSKSSVTVEQHVSIPGLPTRNLRSSMIHAEWSLSGLQVWPLQLALRITPLEVHRHTRGNSGYRPVGLRYKRSSSLQRAGRPSLTLSTLHTCGLIRGGTRARTRLITVVKVLTTIIKRNQSVYLSIYEPHLCIFQVYKLLLLLLHNKADCIICLLRIN